MKLRNKLLVGFLVLIVIIQFIPYAKDHSNPKILQEPKWDTTKTRNLFMKACGDCHSNETKWPWYSNIAPVSWLIAYDVKEGREHFNVSMWNKQKKNKGDEAAEELEEGEMPLLPYIILHPEAKLSDSDKKELIKGLKNTFGSKKD